MIDEEQIKQAFTQITRDPSSTKDSLYDNFRLGVLWACEQLDEEIRAFASKAVQITPADFQTMFDRLEEEMRNDSHYSDDE